LYAFTTITGIADGIMTSWDWCDELGGRGSWVVFIRHTVLV